MKIVVTVEDLEPLVRALDQGIMYIIPSPQYFPKEPQHFVAAHDQGIMYIIPYPQYFPKEPQHFVAARTLTL